MVSVIVPARNEEASLGACLESLVAQTGVSFEIIVVDDGSTDRTREIAQSFPGVRVIDPGPCRPGWTGKNNALVAGATAGSGRVVVVYRRGYGASRRDLWRGVWRKRSARKRLCFRILPSRKSAGSGRRP